MRLGLTVCVCVCVCVCGWARSDSVYYKNRINLRYTPQDIHRTIDFQNSPQEFFAQSEYLNTPMAKQYGITNVCTHVANQGVFFRSAVNRRQKTYWLPGLNAGECQLACHGCVRP